jgi:hypothetical protein
LLPRGGAEGILAVPLFQFVSVRSSQAPSLDACPNAGNIMRNSAKARNTVLMTIVPGLSIGHLH